MTVPLQDCCHLKTIVVKLSNYSLKHTYTLILPFDREFPLLGNGAFTLTEAEADAYT